MELNKEEFKKYIEIKEEIKEELKKELKYKIKEEILKEIKEEIFKEINKPKTISFWNRNNPLIKELHDTLEKKGYYGHSTTQSMFVPYLKAKFGLRNILEITEEQFLQEKDFIYDYIEALPQKEPIIRNECGLPIRRD